MMLFEHKGINFRAEEMGADKQFHIVRRLGPVLAEVASAIGGAKPAAPAVIVTEAPAAPTPAGLDMATAMAGFAGVAGALAKLSDDDANYVLHTLLSHVTREQPGVGWHKVSNGTSLMFADLKLPALMYLMFKALQENLGDFFAAVPSNLKTAFLKQNAP